MTYLGQGLYANDGEPTRTVRVRHRQPRIVAAFRRYFAESADDVRKAQAWSDRADAVRILHRSAS